MDLWLLTCALYYFDVVTDLQQLLLFFDEGQYTYLAISCFGIAIPMIGTIVDSVKWSEGKVPRAQCDIFRRMVPFLAVRLVLVVASVLTQLHVLLLVLASTCMRVKHDLLQGAKQSEVVEAAISALLQSNYWCLTVVGLESIPGASFRSLTLSLLTSCASLSFSFASRDKVDTKVLHVPGKLAWGPLFISLIFFRALEVTSRLLAINMLHLATRAVPVGGPVAVALLVATAWRYFPEANLSQILAAAIAHPGQVLLGDRSRLPLCISLWMQVVLQLVAIGLQGLLHVTNWSLDAKMVPWPLLTLSVSASIVGSLGLCVLARLGSRMQHPFFQEVAQDCNLTCTALATAVDLPKLFVSVLAAVDEITLDLEALKDDMLLQKLEKAKTKVCISASSMQKLEEDLEQTWEQILRLNVSDVDFSECKCLSNLTWDQCHWHLRTVQFRRNCPAAALGMLARCAQLEELTLRDCHLALSDFEMLRMATWKSLKFATFAWCSLDESQAAAALAVLSQCEKLEVVNFYGNDFPTQAAWDELLAGKPWPALQWDRCEFGLHAPSAEYRPPLQAQAVVREAVAEPETAHTLPKCLTHTSLWGLSETHRATLLAQHAACQDIELLDATECDSVPSSEWELLRHASWPQLRVATFGFTFSDYSKGLAGSAALLQLLSGCQRLERIKLSGCCNIPGDAWQALEGTDWPDLREASFDFCFPGGSPGCITAALVLKVLARCSHLERIDFSFCGGASQHFRFLGAASWPELTHASFASCFEDLEEASVQAKQDVLQMLSRCSKLRELNMNECNMQDSHLAELRTGCWPELEVWLGLESVESQLERLRRPDPNTSNASAEPATSASLTAEDLIAEKPQKAIATAEPTGVTAEDVAAEKPEKKARRKVNAMRASHADQNGAEDVAKDGAAAAHNSAEVREIAQPTQAYEPQAREGKARKRLQKGNKSRLAKKMKGR